MSMQHPKYPGLMVYLGSQGEQPKAGAFYMARAGDTLTKVAAKAYGTGRPLLMASIINRSQYNLDLARAGKIHYRVDSSSCQSKTIKKAFPDHFREFGYSFVHTGRRGNTRPVGMDSAWIALCPLNGRLPTIWIPTVDREEPADLISGEGPKTLTPLTKVPLRYTRFFDRSPEPQLPPKADVVLPPGIDAGQQEEEETPRGSRQASAPSWIGWLALAALGGGVVYWYRTSKS